MDWLPGAERILGSASGAYVVGNWKLVLHTTEGPSIDSAVGAYRANNTWPHLTASYHEQRVAQHLPFSQWGRSLEHRAGTVETNRAHAIQVEIVGYAAESPSWPTDQYLWLGRTLAPVLDAFGIPRTAPRFAPANQAPRFGDQEWLDFSGVCGHEHVPHNSHTDPGAFNVAAFFSGGTTAATAQIPQWSYQEGSVKTTLVNVNVQGGNGYADWDPGFGRAPVIVGAVPNAANPPDAGGYPALPTVGALRVDNLVRVVCEHSVDGQIGVWVTVA